MSIGYFFYLNMLLYTLNILYYQHKRSYGDGKIIMKYVLYARLSTKDRGVYGISGQIDSMNNFVMARNGIVLDVFQERESGSNDNRKELNKAILLCKEKTATLLIAKLDRLSRSVEFIFALKRQLGVHSICFEVVDNPDVSNNIMLLGVLGTFAESERVMIASRVKSGMAKAKAAGVKLGRTGPVSAFHKRNIVATLAKRKESVLSEVNKVIVKYCSMIGCSLKNLCMLLNDFGVEPMTTKPRVTKNRPKVSPDDKVEWNPRKLYTIGVDVKYLKSLKHLK